MTGSAEDFTYAFEADASTQGELDIVALSFENVGGIQLVDSTTAEPWDVSDTVDTTGNAMVSMAVANSNASHDSSTTDAFFGFSERGNNTNMLGLGYSADLTSGETVTHSYGNLVGAAMVELTVIPEPSSAGLLLGFVGLAALLRRRRG